MLVDVAVRVGAMSPAFTGIEAPSAPPVPALGYKLGSTGVGVATPRQTHEEGTASRSVGGANLDASSASDGPTTVFRVELVISTETQDHVTSFSRQLTAESIVCLS